MSKHQHDPRQIPGKIQQMVRFVRFIETKQESVPQKATKHQQALLQVFNGANCNLNLQICHNAQIKTQFTPGHIFPFIK